MRLAPVVGLVVLAVHAAALPLLLRSCTRDELVVIAGEVPASIRDRVAIEDAPGPGLHRRRWTMAYRGGFRRQVGATALVGPFQDPDAPACVGRVIVGQRLLDDGAAGPGTVAAAVAGELTRNLTGFSAFPIGDFEKLRSLELTWNRAEHTLADRGFVDAATAPHGYVRARAVVAFSRVDVPVTVALIPALDAGRLVFRIKTKAELDFGNRVFQWASDVLGGDRFATRIAREQIDELLVTVLEPPPPVELPGGRRLVFTYCGEPPAITHRARAELPIAIRIERVGAAPTILPPRLGAAPPAPPPPADVPLALDLELDALNALLFELWRTGFLDEQLAAAGLHDRFNTDPTVAALLTLRISPLRLALPPVLVATPGDRLRMMGELVVTIADRGAVTPGRVWSSLDFHFRAAAPGALSPTVDVGDLELSCEPRPDRLEPCYGDLVDALRARAPDVHDTLTQTFATILADIFVGQRLEDPALPASLVVTGVTPRAFVAAPNGRLRLELAATIQPR